MDTNADTCCLGPNYAVLAPTMGMANVYAYDKLIRPVKGIPILSGGTAYDDPITGKTYILVINQGLDYGTKLDHSLINPNQLRSYGVQVWDNPFDHERGLNVHIDPEVTIPTMNKGTKVLFQTRYPTLQELSNCMHIDITSRYPWEPREVQLSQTSETREVPLPWKRKIQGVHTSIREYLDPRSADAELDLIDATLVGLNGGHLISLVKQYDPNTLDIPARCTFTTMERHIRVTAEEFSKRLGIGVPRAQATLRATLQRGARSAILPLEQHWLIVCLQ